MDNYDWRCRIKSARRKRRLVKTDRDKQLIQLDKRKSELWKQRKELPLIELERPYQRGWKRFFVLREDMKRDSRVEFYEELLGKINTVEYHHDKSFKRRKRRKARYGYVAKQQQLREFHQYSWEVNRMKLTEQEKCCFTRVETFDVKSRRIALKYVFAEPWRYVLKIVPHMVTHQKPVNSEIECELARIENHIDNYYLYYRIRRLTCGRSSRKNRFYEPHLKYINKIKNIPRCSPKQAYLDLE